ncbi:MAG: hypothetical protein AAF264_03635 [Pseudomonadota bacterium]
MSIPEGNGLGPYRQDGDESYNPFYEVKFVDVVSGLFQGIVSLQSVYRGSGGNDTFYAEDGRNWNARLSDDHMDIFDGGTGSDTINYISSAQGITADLATGVGRRLGQSDDDPDLPLV